MRVAGNAASDGYEILVADSGIGISDARLDGTQPQAEPAAGVRCGAEASIGLTVVSMLAARIGATVSLAASDHGGTVATVRIPRRTPPACDRPSRLRRGRPRASTSKPIRRRRLPADDDRPPSLTVPTVEPRSLSMAGPTVGRADTDTDTEPERRR